MTMGGSYAPIGARRSRRRLPLAALGLAAVAGVAGLASYRRGGAAPPALAAAAAAASSEPSITVRNDHGAWRSTTAYPWRYVVEPFRRTTIEVAGSNSYVLEIGLPPPGPRRPRPSSRPPSGATRSTSSSRPR